MTAPVLLCRSKPINNSVCARLAAFAMANVVHVNLHNCACLHGHVTLEHRMWKTMYAKQCAGYRATDALIHAKRIGAHRALTGSSRGGTGGGGGGANKEQCYQAICCITVSGCKLQLNPVRTEGCGCWLLASSKPLMHAPFMPATC